MDLCIDILNDAYSQCNDSLSELNIRIISNLCTLCGFTTPLSRSSNMSNVEGVKSQRVFNLCQSLGASHYISPIGSLDYLQHNNPFANSDIELRFLNFTHPVYPQGKHPFLAFMAVIDALAWVGPARLAMYIRDGVGKERTIEEQIASTMDRAA